MYKAKTDAVYNVQETRSRAFQGPFKSGLPRMGEDTELLPGQQTLGVFRDSILPPGKKGTSAFLSEQPRMEIGKPSAATGGYLDKHGTIEGQFGKKLKKGGHMDPQRRSEQAAYQAKYRSRRQI